MSLNLDSPRSGEEFKRYWNRFIHDISDRPNLKPSHLWQLQVLCDLCVEYDELREIISLTGRTCDNGGGRNGSIIRPTAEYLMLQKVIVEIRNYSKMLDLVLMPDTKTTKEEEHNEFI